MFLKGSTLSFNSLINLALLWVFIFHLYFLHFFVCFLRDYVHFQDFCVQSSLYSVSLCNNLVDNDDIYVYLLINWI